ncbi:MAG TPA: hypothetical protein VJ976_06655 [Ornithinimicrobium sp.]|uniref:hypothetical protein n=1 Tax=Ornithinimicrobium sp. TaxID=1977084 RepID=UPI002B49305A|nr:hypothetical protein [Ornithinimicrobium sp.]HKJ12055.1 hypothetical protein [Ornithinimicrobium sp.]
MNLPPATPGTGPLGLWLCRGRAREVNDWAAKSVVPLLVARRGAHTAVVPRGSSAVGAPYDDAATLCAARPAPAKVAPAIGFWVIEDRAVITVQARTWRRRIRWVVWDPEQGVIRPPGVDIATPQQVLAAAGGGSRSELVEMLGERHHTPPRLLSAVVTVLGLPGADVLLDPAVADTWPRSTRHEPDDRQVEFFEDAVKHAVALRRELGLRG